jgi:hypothetical protein
MSVMYRAVRSLLSATATLLACTGVLHAQEKSFHGWGLLGGGVGSANVSCSGDSCATGWDLHGPTFLISVGYLFTPHWGLGLGLDKWWRSPSDTEATNTAILFTRYYPSVHAGAFIEAGAGISRAGVELAGNTTADGLGGAVMAAVGYDVRLLTSHGADIMLTPRVSYTYSPVGDLKYADGSVFATGWRHQVLSFGFGLAMVGSRTQW